MTNIIEFDVETTGLQPYAGNQRAFMYIFSGVNVWAFPLSAA